MENSTSSAIAENNDSQLTPMFRLCIAQLRAYWIWFLLSTTVCLAIGYLYQQRQPRIYQRQAVMLIEDAEPTSSFGPPIRRNRSNMSTLLELNGVSVGDNLINEMFILTSRRLMERVVDTLQLDIDYTIQQNLHEVTLYGDRPFEVSFAQKAKHPADFKVKMNKDHTFTLHSFRLFTPDGEDPELKGEAFLKNGEAKQTPIGLLQIKSNPAVTDFPTDKEVTVTYLPKKIAAAVYSNKVTANEYDKESSLIVLSCNDVNPYRAEDIVREVYNAYKQDVVDNKNRVAHSTAQFIDERIHLIGKDLSDIENRMAQFKRNNQLIDFEQNAHTFIAESSTAHRLTLDIEMQLAVACYLREFLQGQSMESKTIPVLSLPNASFAPLINEYNKLMIERNRMADNSSDTSPAVRDLDKQLTAMRSSLQSSIGSYTSSLELQLHKSRLNESALTGKLGAVPEKEKLGIDIKRQQELKSTLYTYLLNKREEVALQMAISEANVRLVEEPLGSTAPIRPCRSVILLVSLLIGLLLPAGILWLRHILDITISSRKDIEDATTIPIVGEIPHWNESENSRGLISKAESDAPIAEAFRILRYGLNFMRHSAKVFVVTSASPGQGKSFISCNMAYILGSTGKRTLFVDADIRKRTASITFGNGKGLTALLADEENELHLTDVVIPNAISKNVDFLPAGKRPPHPTELLMTPKLEEIIEEAKKIYSYIVIDTTPAIAVADAGIVSRVANITVFVMRIGVQEREFLPELESIYKARKFRNLCIVINDANVKQGYYGGYGYGYGYGNTQEAKHNKHFLPWKKKR